MCVYKGTRCVCVCVCVSVCVCVASCVQVLCTYAPELCNCTLDYIRNEPNLCMAGNITHARNRMAAQVRPIQLYISFPCIRTHLA